MAPPCYGSALFPVHCVDHSLCLLLPWSEPHLVSLSSPIATMDPRHSASSENRSKTNPDCPYVVLVQPNMLCCFRLFWSLMRKQMQTIGTGSEVTAVNGHGHGHGFINLWNTCYRWSLGVWKFGLSCSVELTLTP